jgi:signal transduction histidine kinase
MNGLQVKVLLVEDDKDDYLLVRDLLSQIEPSRYALKWEPSYRTALTAIRSGGYDVCLLDYCLGDRTGLDLMREASDLSCRAPIIFLARQGDYQIDLEAMRAGAADYLIKSQINAPLLDRSIRYAIEHKRAEEELRESHRRLQALSSQLLDAQENERKRIAKELHDGIGQILTAVKFGVENSLQMAACSENHPCQQSLTAVISVIQNGIDEIRRISRDLWPTILSDLGILPAINWYCREFQSIYSEMRISREIDVLEEEVPEELKITLYRVLQEATNNAAKHSKGDQVSLSLKKNRDRLELTVSDNGQGFDLSSTLDGQRSRKGLGLTSMRERTELSGGSFSIESVLGKGTVVRASWAATAALLSESSTS